MWGTQAAALQQPSNLSGVEGAQTPRALPPAASSGRYISPFALMWEQGELFQPVRLLTKPPAIAAPSSSWAPRTPPQSELGILHTAQSISGELCAPGAAPVYAAGGSGLWADWSAPEVSPSLPAPHEAARSCATSSSRPILFPGGRRKWTAWVPEAPLSREQQKKDCNAQSWPDEWVRSAVAAAPYCRSCTHGLL
jgi:hypothetical protein